jgi:amidohydrolase
MNLSITPGATTKQDHDNRLLIDEVKQLARNNKEEVLTFRRHLHANPELSFHEYKTSAFIKRQLDKIGISWQAMADTGIVAMIKGDQPSDRVIALRADMDALPITEENNLAYKSVNNGVMHACGHDVHTSCLLGTAAILESMKKSFGGTVKLIFQPAEEKLPGGASLMIGEGVLQNPVPSSVTGQHVMPFIETGKIGLRAGKMMASMDEIYVTVSGKGGHGAQPHKNIDPVTISSQIIIALQQIVSRTANPTIPSVLSFGKVIANGSVNVIPDQVYMEGTFRTMNEGWRSEAHLKMKKIAEGIAESFGAHCDFNIKKGYPFLVNEEKLTRQVTGFAGEYLGKENVMEVEQWMAAEDFAYYSQVTDACFYLLGSGNKEKHITSSLHTPTFNVDEECLMIGSGLMAYVAIRQLLDV